MTMERVIKVIVDEALATVDRIAEVREACSRHIRRAVAALRPS